MSDLAYYKDYLNGLNDFIYKESKDLTIRQYMLLVMEILTIKQHINTLNTTKNGTNLN